MSSTPFQVEDLLAHQGFLRALARELVRDEARAEDVVQDAYVAALERPPRSGAALRAWLATVVRNLAINARRGDSRRGAREQAASRPEAAPSHEVVADRLEVSRRLIESVQALAEPYRSTLYLRFYEGLGPGAIARRQAVSTDTVKTRLRRGLAQLRASMDADQERSLWTAALLPLAVGRDGALTGGVSKAATIAGGILGMKKLVWAAAALIVVLGGWSLLRRPTAAPAQRIDSVASVAIADPEAGPVDAKLIGSPQPERSPVASVTATAPSVAANTSSLALRVVWAGDHSPAENVELLVARGGLLEGRDARRCVSDAEGRVLFEDLPVGLVTVQAYRGSGLYTYRVPAADEEAEFVVPRGFDLSGTVVDPTGRRVPGADVWLSRWPSGWLGARRAVIADENGRFSLRDVGADRAISARAPGFGASFRESLSTRRVNFDEPLELTLELRGPGGVVAGQVVDTEGRPLAEAWVAVGSQWQHAQRPSGNWSPLAPPALMRTDAEGRFRAEGVDVAEQVVVQTLAQGFCPAAQAVDVVAGETSEIVVRLEPDGVVEGTVRDSDGRGLPGVLVRLWEINGWNPALDFFPGPTAVSAADGTYRLEGLSRGELSLTARYLETGSGLGEAQTQVRVEPGHSYSWDPILSAVFEISGTLVDEDGQVVAERGVSLVAEKTGLPAMNPVATDADGGFRFYAEPGTYALSAREADGDYGTPLLEGVEAGTTDVMLVVDTHLSAAAFVIGLLDDAGGRIGAQDRVQVLLMEPQRSVATAEIVDGAFRLGPVAPGSYRVTVKAGERTVLSTHQFQLAPGARHDVGLLETELPGSVRIDFTADEDLEPESVQLMAMDYEHGYSHSLVLNGGAFLGEELLPGSYDIMVFGDRAASFNAPFEVRSGQEAATTIHLRRGAYRMFAITVPEDADPWREVTFRVTDGRGKEIYRYAGPPIGGARDDEVSFGFGFWQGTFELHVELDNGLTATHELDIHDHESDYDPISLTLR